MKTPNTPYVPGTNMDMTDLDKMQVPLLIKVYDMFRLMCQFCKQSVLHPSPQDQTGQIKIGLGNNQKHKKPAGLLYQRQK